MEIDVTTMRERVDGGLDVKQLIFMIFILSLLFRDVFLLMLFEKFNK